MPEWFSMTTTEVVITCLILVIIYLLRELKCVKYQYNVLNTWAFAADKLMKLDMLKTGNSQGDVMLDWDSVPKQEKALIIKLIKSSKRT